jgi:anhydro-N-acetylmuramic acid kinase
LAEISTEIDQTVVCDFRVQDVQLGGQVLLCAYDQMLFPQYDYCMNLGGFSNVSFEQNGNRIAFYASEYRFKFYANQLIWIMMIRAHSQEQEPAITPC